MGCSCRGTPSRLRSLPAWIGVALWLAGCGNGASGGSEHAEDASSGDTATSDAGPDAKRGDAPEGPGESAGCVDYPGAVFCDDFEKPGSFSANWSDDTGNPATVVSSATAYSPTHVASLVSLGPSATTSHSLPTILTSQRLRIAFSVRVMDAPRAYVVLADITLAASVRSVGMNIGLQLDDGELTVQLLNDMMPPPGSDAGAEVPLMALATGEWVRVELDCNVSTTGSVKVLVNGAPSTTLPYSPGESFNGDYYGNLGLLATDSASVQFDDVVVWQD
jgi:hypothetical protein